MKYFLAVYICLMGYVSQAQQWTRINALPPTNFVTLAKDNNMLYAVTFGNTLFISPDNGTTWRASMPGPDSVIIESFAIFNNKIYLGTDDTGVWMTSDTGRTWTNSAHDIFPVASFAEWRNNLYAATLGDGIFKLNTANNTWQPFNADIPSYSANVFKIINENDTLIAAAGSNGTYYRFNPATAVWDENFYAGRLLSGLQAPDILYNSGSMFITDGGTVLRRTNNGTNWHIDTIGLRQGFGFNATIGFGNTNFYAAVNTPPGGTWIQKQNLAIGNEAWTDEGDFIPGGFTFALLEFNSRIFLCRSDGIYFKDLITAVGDAPGATDDKISIYPNPSGGSTVNVKSDQLVNEITIVNLSGAVVFHSAVQKKEFKLPFLQNGLYIAQLRVNKKLRSYKILIE